METHERLVLVADDEAKHALKRLPEVHVAQWASPRVALVSGSPTDLRRLEATPGIEIISGESETLPKQLDETEALFARAWLLRSRGRKARVGEGLDWDAAGFEPPDPPLHGR